LNKIIKHIAFFILLIIAATSCNKDQAGIELKETFYYTDNNPFGGSVAHSILSNAFPSTKININKKKFSENYDWAYEENAIYFSLSKNYYPSEEDITSLIEFVQKGNTAFISANKFDALLTEKINASVTYNIDIISLYPYQQTQTNIIPSLTLYNDSTNYYYYPFVNSFSTIPSKNTKIIGTNNDGKTNFFVYFLGKGRIFLHNEPRALSNYFLLTKNNHLYMKQIVQLLLNGKNENGLTKYNANTSSENNRKIIWDNYYPKRNASQNKSGGDGGGGSSLSEIFKHPPLIAAFWIILSLLILFILFGIKRRQRIVPIVKPPQNTSIAFAEAIAGLYLSKKDNKVIADKIITFFNEQIRTKYYINLPITDAGYADVLSRKTGVALETTQALVKNMLTAAKSEKVSDVQLLSLNGLVEKFFKNKI
jgi:hypothetical protein